MRACFYISETYYVLAAHPILSFEKKMRSNFSNNHPPYSTHRTTKPGCVSPPLHSLHVSLFAYVVDNFTCVAKACCGYLHNTKAVVRTDDTPYASKTQTDQRARAYEHFLRFKVIYYTMRTDVGGKSQTH